MRVVLVPSNPTFSAIFAEEAKRIRAALGADVLAVEHVGSTAVPGLDAKPIVDVLVVTDGADAPLAGIGLVRDGEAFWKRREPAVHVHVRAPSSPDIARWIAFRDRLRADAADRALYLEAKRRLAEREWARGRDYADAKAAVIAEILRRA